MHAVVTNLAVDAPALSGVSLAWDLRCYFIAAAVGQLHESRQTGRPMSPLDTFCLRTLMLHQVGTSLSLQQCGIVNTAPYAAHGQSWRLVGSGRSLSQGVYGQPFWLAGQDSPARVNPATWKDLWRTTIAHVNAEVCVLQQTVIATLGHMVHCLPA